MNVQRIQSNLESVRERIATAARRAGRPEDGIRLVAVTKKSPIEWVRPLVAFGACDLGENYPQELWRKCELLADLGGSIRWHLIGHLQTNKVKKTLPLVKMIHSVDSLKLLQVLDQVRTDACPILRECVCKSIPRARRASTAGPGDQIFATPTRSPPAARSPSWG